MGDREEERPSQLRAREARNGFLMGVGLLALSGYVFVSGWFLPHPEGWLTAPAMLPLFLSGSLFIMAAVITLDTVRQGALRVLFVVNRTADDPNRPLWRILFAMTATGVFYFGLLRWLKFEIAAFIFLFAMMRMYWPEGRFGIRLAIALLLPFLMSGMFQGLFGIPLPGDGNLMQDFLYWLGHRGK